MVWGLLFKILQNFHRFKRVRFYILFPFSLCTIFTPARYILPRYTFLKTRFYWRIDQKWTWPNTTQKKCLFITTHTLHLLHSHMQIWTSSICVQALSSRWISIWTAVCSVIEFPFCYLQQFVSDLIKRLKSYRAVHSCICLTMGSKMKFLMKFTNLYF